MMFIVYCASVIVFCPTTLRLGNTQSSIFLRKFLKSSVRQFRFGTVFICGGVTCSKTNLRLSPHGNPVVLGEYHFGSFEGRKRREIRDSAGSLNNANTYSQM